MKSDNCLEPLTQLAARERKEHKDCERKELFFAIPVFFRGSPLTLIAVFNLLFSAGILG